MQTLGWYARRLTRMTPGEMLWRARGATRDATDRCRLAVGAYPPVRLRAGAGAGARVRLHTLPVPCGGRMHPRWLAALVARADALFSHRFTFGSLQDRWVGDPIDWNRDHESGVAAPLRFSAALDYRDYRVTGDAKVVWELNRHHHLVVLARAYRATGDRRYARTCVEHLLSWIDQCPFGRGMNWRSPLELAIRAINWIWTLDLIAPADALAPGECHRIEHALDVHVWEIARRYSRGSSANNHRIGEAAGVFVVTSCRPDLPDAVKLREESRAILCEEIQAQTFAGGCSREHALGYHFFALQFFTIAALVGRRDGREFPAEYLARLGAMAEFARALSAAGDPPLFGDADDGYVLDLGQSGGDWRDSLAMAEALRGEDDNGAAGSEAAVWLTDGAAAHPRAGIRPDPERLMSRGFADAGYYLLQWGSAEDADRVSVLFDCAELGFGAIAAHGHADALSFTLRAFGEDVLVDPGTYDYFTYPAWRDYFRSTRAHNTVEVDGTDQSRMLGPFMWGERAQSRCLDWRPSETGGRVSAEHDGYARLSDPVIHRRTLQLDRSDRTLLITDAIAAAAPHRVAMHFHCAEHARVTREGTHVVSVAVRSGIVRLVLDPRTTVTLLEGTEDSMSGWISRRYHQKRPSVTIRAALETSSSEVCTRIAIGVPGSGLA